MWERWSGSSVPPPTTRPMPDRRSRQQDERTESGHKGAMSRLHLRCVEWVHLPSRSAKWGVSDPLPAAATSSRPRPDGVAHTPPSSLSRSGVVWSSRALEASAADAAVPRSTRGTLTTSTVIAEMSSPRPGRGPPSSPVASPRPHHWLVQRARSRQGANAWRRSPPSDRPSAAETRQVSLAAVSSRLELASI